jgi:hypothetical protein
MKRPAQNQKAHRKLRRLGGRAAQSMNAKPPVSGRRTVLRKRREPAAAALVALETRTPHEQSRELPAAYGRTRLTLMEVHPYLVHAYWEVTPEDRAAAVKQMGAESSSVRWVLRFYEAIQNSPEHLESGGQFDVPVDLAPGSWYVTLPAAGRFYYADLGPIAASGRFVAACRSNTVHAPRSDASPHYEPQWLEVTGAGMRREPQPQPEGARPAPPTATEPTGTNRTDPLLTGATAWTDIGVDWRDASPPVLEDVGSFELGNGRGESAEVAGGSRRSK